MLAAYEGKCAISGCDVQEVGDAAHIQPFYEGGTDTLRNGLLLRADLHIRFDRNLIAIDHERMTVIISPSLRESQYEDLEGRHFELPSSPAVHPSSVRLHAHRLKLRSQKVLGGPSYRMGNSEDSPITGAEITRSRAATSSARNRQRKQSTIAPFQGCAPYFRCAWAKFARY
ncbi:MAG: HNH endonuclease [Chloroflexia bacterium]|nr:HNH endonuclease [Chloroflexia bacterium]